MRAADRASICVVGSGTRFLSGISIYTYRLATALERANDVCVILMRRLLPARLYPGYRRVGATLARLAYPASVDVLDGVDWYWVPSLARALAFLFRHRPRVVIFQWWSGTVLHSYLVLAAVARLFGARVVIEFHEILDSAEERMPMARQYVRLLAPLLMRMSSGFAVHSRSDHALLDQRYDLKQRPVVVLPHGPHDHYQGLGQKTAYPETRGSLCNLLYFGVIRPYKGVEDLIQAFDGLTSEQVKDFWLTIVGETWEEWELPSQLIARSRHRDRITFVNRYVADSEVAGFFERADAVVLPYHRATTSGPLHVAMGYGLPVVASELSSIKETVEGYDGALLVPPSDPDRLRLALLAVKQMKGKSFRHPHGWEEVAAAYHELFAQLEGAQSKAPATEACESSVPAEVKS